MTERDGATYQRDQADTLQVPTAMDNEDNAARFLEERPYERMKARIISAAQSTGSLLTRRFRH